MSIIALGLGLLFLAIVVLIGYVAYKMYAKADVREKRAELELINEIAEEVDEANKDLNVLDIDKKRKEIKKFTQT